MWPKETAKDFNPNQVLRKNAPLTPLKGKRRGSTTHYTPSHFTFTQSGLRLVRTEPHHPRSHRSLPPLWIRESAYGALSDTTLSRSTCRTRRTGTFFPRAFSCGAQKTRVMWRTRCSGCKLAGGLTRVTTCGRLSSFWQQSACRTGRNRMAALRCGHVCGYSNLTFEWSASGRGCTGTDVLRYGCACEPATWRRV